MLDHITQVSRVLSRGIAPMMPRRVRVLDADSAALDDESTRRQRCDRVFRVIDLPHHEVRATSHVEPVAVETKDGRGVSCQHRKRVQEIARRSHVTADYHEKAHERGIRRADRRERVAHVVRRGGDGTPAARRRRAGASPRRTEPTSLRPIR